MLILLLLLLLLLLFALLFAIYKLVKWTLKDKIRVKWAFTLLFALGLVIAIKKVYFTRMEFIQSKVYSNLYIVENPEKDSLLVKKAILEKIKEHLRTQHKQKNKLSYSNETDCIYFYENGGRTLGFLGEAGTSYFIDNEEDLGGFVSEELGMYPEYRLVEFYYQLPENKTNEIFGEINYFYEGKHVNTDSVKIQIKK
ncbi:hypothetical protein EQG68_11845 [Flavobacterium piscinae]|uniref:Uncharacterized protein n=1 Tax=Flavobacterium piscinae TaxID=2506424 RepID=A0A4Q1KKZ8_9FLAO|nr:hypothetical protein [Flavobacterium piscinae]RXR30115.1 hypothetical protein EQG68_11845 [Flavobacterium piscinae]